MRQQDITVMGPGEMSSGIHYSTVMGLERPTFPPPPSAATIKASITRLKESVFLLSAHVVRLEDAMEISPRLASLQDSLVWRTAALEGSDTEPRDGELPPLSFFWNLNLSFFNQASTYLAANKNITLREFLITCKEGGPRIVTVAEEWLENERELSQHATLASG